MSNFPIQNFLISHGVPPLLAPEWGNYYLAAMRSYGIDTPNRIAAFFANVLHESSNLTRLVENLNYSKEGLAKTWPKRYSTTRTRHGKPNALAIRLHRNPQLIANYTYANRMGNGSPESGDGWKYRGRGPIQVTGKNNYISISEKTGLDCIDNPDILSTARGGVISSCVFWRDNPCRYYADRDDFDGVRDVINFGRKTATVGDAIGYQDAVNRYRLMKNWIARNAPQFTLP